MNRTVVIRAALALVALTVLLPWAPSVAEEVMSPKAWTEDLDYLVTKIREIHIKPFHTVSEKEFNGAVTRLKSRLPDLTDGQAALELARITSLIGDGHTMVSPYREPYLRRYPFSVFPFSDGLFVTRAMEPYGRLRGARLVAIGDTDAMDVLDSAKEYVSGDNEWSLLAGSPYLMTIGDFLQMKGFISNVGNAVFHFEMPDGRQM